MTWVIDTLGKPFVVMFGIILGIVGCFKLIGMGLRILKAVLKRIEQVIIDFISGR